MTSVAVLGTGIMGSAMARNLVAAGLRTTVWDRAPEATAPLAASGALVAASSQDAISDARVVITMLPTKSSNMRTPPCRPTATANKPAKLAGARCSPQATGLAASIQPDHG